MGLNPDWPKSNFRHDDLYGANQLAKKAHIDALAAGGLRYSNFHVTPLCSPTRAALLTGRNHHSVGMGIVANWDTGFPGFRGRIAKSAGTLAELLTGHPVIRGTPTEAALIAAVTGPWSILVSAVLSLVVNFYFKARA